MLPSVKRKSKPHDLLGQFSFKKKKEEETEKSTNTGNDVEKVEPSILSYYGKEFGMSPKI